MPKFDFDMCDASYRVNYGFKLKQTENCKIITFGSLLITFHEVNTFGLAQPFHEIDFSLNN